MTVYVKARRHLPEVLAECEPCTRQELLDRAQQADSTFSRAELIQGLNLLELEDVVASNKDGKLELRPFARP